MRETGEREQQGGDRRSKLRDATLILSDLGISRDRASRAMQLADVPGQDFEEVLARSALPLYSDGREVQPSLVLNAGGQRGIAERILEELSCA